MVQRNSGLGCIRLLRLQVDTRRCQRGLIAGTQWHHRAGTRTVN
jgi:hypothetical protein